ncbi:MULTISPECIES: phosphate-starvation-inducible protein PsiE [Sphingomonas]|uniref:phosphate-starvation-inducible protein PsiE n=1 Tax=Sphingomonas TaxID=13687 RepID=UPI00082E9AED|nr:phosphate-starvation-inducible PsiE family protein [Sphingomonas sp. CCH10-B3]
MQPDEQTTTDKAISSFAVTSFHLLEHGLLIIIALLTIGAVAREIASVTATMTVTLADILQMFLYTEVISMIGVFYTGRGSASPFVYPIFIAITALSRLIVLQGKEMKPENIVFEASAILLLSVAIMIILRSRRDAA